MAKEVAEQINLEVEARSAVGTSKAQQVRRKGAIPGVVYGKSKDPVAVSINFTALAKVLRSGSGEHGLITLTIQDAKGKASKPNPVLIKEVQHHPVDGHVMHVDFQAVSLKERIVVPVDIHLIGEAEGVKVGGGILEHFLRVLDIQCLPTEIPHSIDVEISHLKVGESLHVKDIKAPENMTIVNDPEASIVSVTPPRVEKSTEEEAAAVGAAEPEVIREKKEGETAS